MVRSSLWRGTVARSPKSEYWRQLGCRARLSATGKRGVARRRMGMRFAVPGGGGVAMPFAKSLVLTAAIAFSLPARAAVTTVREVTRELHKYNAEERKLADAGAQSPADLMAHWQRL